MSHKAKQIKYQMILLLLPSSFRSRVVTCKQKKCAGGKVHKYFK